MKHSSSGRTPGTMIFFRSGNFKSAADTFATLIDDANENGALQNQLPSLCLNCAHMYGSLTLSKKSDRWNFSNNVQTL